MPFELVNLFIIFLSYINKCLAEKLDDLWIIYLDDIFIYTSIEKAQRDEAVWWILEQLEKSEKDSNLKKCCFSTDETHC